jgi:hypothetical protein
MRKLKRHLGNLDDNWKAKDDAKCSGNGDRAFAIGNQDFMLSPSHSVSEIDRRENGTHLWGVGRCDVKGPNGESTGKSLLANTKRSISATHGI